MIGSRAENLEYCYDAWPWSHRGESLANKNYCTIIIGIDWIKLVYVWLLLDVRCRCAMLQSDTAKHQNPDEILKHQRATIIVIMH